jgi:hypothetical protein
LVTNVDIVIDTIDFYSINDEIILHESARKNNKPVFLSQVAGSKATFTYFSPQGPSLQEIVYKEGSFNMLKSINFFFPELPAESGKFLMNSIIRGDRAVIPSISVKPVITAALMVEDILKYTLKGSYIKTPDIAIYDFNKRTYKVLNRNLG